MAQTAKVILLKEVRPVSRQIHADDAVTINPAIRKRLSTGFVDRWEQDPVLEIGDVYFTRLEMVETLGCGNFNAATRFTKLLRKLKIFSIAQLNKLDPFSLHNTKGVGDAQLMVAMKLLEYGGYDVDHWWEYHTHPSLKRRQKQEV